MLKRWWIAKNVDTEMGYAVFFPQSYSVTIED